MFPTLEKLLGRRLPASLPPPVNPASKHPLQLPELPRQNVSEHLASRRSSNPVTALVQRIQDSPSTTAVVLGAMGAMTLVSFTPREAMALPTQELDDQKLEVDLALLDKTPDPNEEELKEKVSALVERDFGGDYHAAFTHYDKNGDGGVSKKELHRLLDDAGVGNIVTRGFWVDGLMKKIDKQGGNDDGRIQWSEFQSVVAART